MATKKTSGRSHGFKHKSRSVMTKKGPRGVSFLLREYNVGDRALVQLTHHNTKDCLTDAIMEK